MIELKFSPAQNSWLEVTWVDGETQLKHTSYHPTQLDLLQADAVTMGTSLDDHAQMLSDWVASYVPPPPEPVQIPKSVTMRQARIALSKQGLLQTVQTAIQNSDNEVLKIEWEYATEIKRDWPTLQSIALLLNLTDSQLDALFLEASTL